jgi:hypothetical protein
MSNTGVTIEEGAEMYKEKFMPDGIPPLLQFMILNGLGPEDMDTD